MNINILRRYQLLAAFIVVVGFLGTFDAAHAAVLEIQVDKTSLRVGSTLTADVKVDSEGRGINAAQATVSFPADVLEVVRLSKDGSVFNFWLEEPSFSNERGTVTFLGGSSNGFSGASLQLLQIVFRAKGAGNAALTFTDAAVTASDGSGTNVLSTTRGVEVRSTATEELVVVPPTQITREPAPSETAPAGSTLTVSLYPDPEKWYNRTANFLVRWPLPADVTDVATIVNRSPNTNPTVSEGLFDNKIFPALDDGVWYLHVRFRNPNGWGPTSHHRIAIDTLPPLPFDVRSLQGSATDEPRITISYESGDELSGIKQYKLQIDGGTPSEVDMGETSIGPLAPGMRVVRVSAEDFASNITEASLQVEIIPLEAPIIDTVRERVFLHEDTIFINGVALPEHTLTIRLKDKNDIVVRETELTTDSAGGWSYEMAEPVRRGEYYFELVLSDERGAKSLPIHSPTITVKERPILTVGGFEITQTPFFILLIILLFVAFAFGWYIRRLQARQRDVRVFIAEREVSAMIENMKREVKKAQGKIGDWHGELDMVKVRELKAAMDRLAEYLERVDSYVLQGIAEINEEATVIGPVVMETLKKTSAEAAAIIEKQGVRIGRVAKERTKGLYRRFTRK